MDTLETYQVFADKARLELQKNPQWKNNFKRYATSIISAQETIHKEDLAGFRVHAPLYLYTTIKDAMGKKSSLRFILRYKGQEVASISQKKSMVYVKIDEKQAERNHYFFRKNDSKDHLITKSGCFPWNSDEGREFRRFFGAFPDKNNSNAEHTLESILLTELEKSSAADKSLCGIQPVKLNGKRFQMKTAFAASKLKSGGPVYSNKGGGIDILARRKTGNHTYLTVIELKDENRRSESPEIAIRQAISYSVFIRELLRSGEAGGREWYRLFGFHEDLPDKLMIKCAVAMPDVADVNVFKEKAVYLEGDTIELHCLCIDKENGRIRAVSSGF